MRILVLDNYDSFTFNLVHYLEKVSGIVPEVFRNDEISLTAIQDYHKILISPGPGLPPEAGITKELIQQYGSEKSILGICLGLQAIGEVYGANLRNLEEVYHGVATDIRSIRQAGLFKGIPEHFKAGRYHSWVVDGKDLPSELEITAMDHRGNIMGLRHRELDVQGVQFHPESILTEHGEQLLKNWIES
jgi:anthranilate synthase component 2